MKILAIRGANLASLTKFAVDLASGPLAGTNIFAIVGPTGAGKSTLLDALCLALYGRTPRLSGKSGVQIGFHDSARDLRIGAVDPRSIMRRGAGEAHAEVDFAGIDGQKWRASWTVHRARKRPDGAVQQPRISLVDLESETDKTLATNSETLGLIEEKTGLSFVQFCRSVLLAQGEFAAFLKATPDERAQLLEQMTGTEIYGDLSRQAHLGARAAIARLEELERELDGVRVLSEEERLRLAADRMSLEERRTTLEDTIEEIRKAFLWHEELDRLSSDLTNAERDLDEARKAWEDLGTLRDEVASVESACSFQPALDELDAARRDMTDAKRAEERGEALHEESEAALGRAKEIVANGERHLTAARATYEDAAPALDRARVLDAQIADAGEAVEEANAALRAAAGAVTDLEAALAGRREAESQARRSAAAASDWLDTHSEVAALAEQWPRWEAELREYAAAHAERVVHATALRKAEADLERVAARLGACRAELDAAYNAKADATSELGRAREALEAVRADLPAGDAQRALQQVAEYVVAVDALVSILDAAYVASQQRSEELDRSAHELAQAERCKARETEAIARCEDLMWRLSEAQREWSRALAEQEMAARRGDLLVEGTPCPLCGSTEHPWADLGAPPSETSIHLGNQVQDLQRHYDEARSLLVAARAEAATRSEAAELARGRAGDFANEVNRLAAAWSDRRAVLVRAGLAVPEHFGAPAVRDSLLDTRSSLVRRREGLAALEERALELQATLDERRAYYDARAAEIEHLAPRFEAAREEVATAQRHRESVARDLEVSRDRCLRSRETLESVLASIDRWVMDFEDDPGAFMAARATQVAEWQRRTGAYEDAKGRLAALGAAIAAAEDEIARAREYEAGCADTARRRRERADALRAERSAVLGGRPRDDVDRALRHEIAARERALSSSRTVYADLSARRDHALSEAARAREALAAARHRLWSCESKVDTAVNELGVANVAALRTLVGRAGEWLEARRGEIASSRERVVKLEGLVDDRARRHAEHLAARSMPASKDDLREQFDGLEAELRNASEQLGVIADRLAQDAANQRHVLDLAPRVEEQRRAAHTMTRLDELIGSADGKKFRRFAQSLTLDALLAQTNHHLAELRPRYKVTRVPGFEMEMQVIDADMGDEVRTIASLSGGETFLVSLALALGLSSLAAGNVRIESLFIDEGFGTLDKDTLEVALSVLDQLQAEGRCIGLISHVPDLAERVGYQVLVEPIGPGRSSVRVAGAAPARAEALMTESPPGGQVARRKPKRAARREDATAP